VKPLIYRALFLVCWLSFGAADAQDLPKQEAVQRLVRSHDPSIFVATGALYLKQEAIRANGGKPLSPGVLAEVDRLIDANVRDPAWFYAGLSGAADRFLSAEEADEIATHFDTEGGQLQRRVIELAVGEVLMNVYTFTDRIDYRVKGSSRELQDLQSAVGPMRGTCACPTPRDIDNLKPVADGRAIQVAQDLSVYPGTVKFASGGAGVKYVKILMMQGIESMTAHFEAVAKQIREIVVTQEVGRLKSRATIRIDCNSRFGNDRFLSTVFVDN
jgi:hypothetical protein